MNVKISDLMSDRVIAAQPHHTVEHVRALMDNNGISAVPVLDSDGEPVGIVTSTDLVADRSPSTRVNTFMTDSVKVIPAYNDVSAAARAMRNAKVHHMVVTHEKKVVGILSSFDLLKLVEDHRFVMKAAPTPSGKSKKKD